MNNLSSAWEKACFIFDFLENKQSSTLKFRLDCFSRKKKGLIIKQAKFKHNNIFVNKLVNIRLDLTLYNIIFLYVYLFILYLFI